MNSLRNADAFHYHPRLPKGLRLIGSATDKRWYTLGLALVIAGIPTHQPLLIVIGVIVLLILLITDIWAIYCLDNLKYQRLFSEQRVLFGEEITLTLRIENAKPLPLPWLEVEDTIPRVLPLKNRRLFSGLRGDQVMLECLFSPRWYERVTRHYTIACTARGVHTFGPTVLRSGDVFGFVSREMALPYRQYVLVYPLIAPLERFGLPARHPFGMLRAPRQLLEDPARVVGIRDYMYGDNLRRVNWKATARSTRLQSKVYETTTTHTFVLFLNVVSQLDIHYGIRPELQELSICSAASVANWALDQGYAVGLYANTIMFMPDEELSSEYLSALSEEQGRAETANSHLQRRRIRLPVASNEEQRKRIMEVLARIQSYFGASIEDVLHTERTRLPVGSTVLVITSTLSEQLVDTLVRMRQGGHAITILFVGDAPPPMRLAGLKLHYIGGEERWQDLQSTYQPETRQPTQSPPGFRL